MCWRNADLHEEGDVWLVAVQGISLQELVVAVNGAEAPDGGFQEEGLVGQVAMCERKMVDTRPDAMLESVDEMDNNKEKFITPGSRFHANGFFDHRTTLRSQWMGNGNRRQSLQERMMEEEETDL